MDNCSGDLIPGERAAVVVVAERPFRSGVPVLLLRSLLLLLLMRFEEADLEKDDPVDVAERGAFSLSPSMYVDMLASPFKPVFAGERDSDPEEDELPLALELVTGPRSILTSAPAKIFFCLD